MMKTLKIALLIGCFAFFHNSKAQNLVINGGFELQDGTAPAGSDFYSIEYATGWHNLLGTCDLVPLVNRPSRTGVGAGSLGVTPSGYTEFCYGNTQSLITGHIYKVSFWVRKDYEPDNGSDLTVGLLLSANLPSSFSNTTPTISVKVETTQWVKAEGCFVANQNTEYFVSIGPFGSSGAPETILVEIDDVEVIDVTGLPSPTASVTIPQNQYCVGDNVILDGSTSTDESEYQWKILLNGVQEVYNSGILTGTASSLNATPYLSFLQPGACYKAELTVYGTCTDVASTTFCFENPQINFLNGNEAVCGNTPIDLEITGDNGWTYQWSTGQTGVGLKNISVTPAPPNASYSVTATTLLGCTVTENINLIVHDPNNLAPWMNGINGTGEYIAYVNQGDQISFSSTLFNDHSNEDVFNNVVNPSLPAIFFSSTYPSSNTGVFNFSLNAGFGALPNLPLGAYQFTVTTTDENACENKGAEFVFTVKVICPDCDICTEYENRTPTDYPLPLETRAAKCIQAGLSEDVIVGDVNVLFQAGEYIELGPFFESGSNFEGVIDPSTCLSNCNYCCVDFTGFTIDLPLEDDIITSSTGYIWEAFDTDNPYCAYNARAYKLIIEGENNGDVMYEKYEENIGCCGFFSSAPNNPISHSSIFWDGIGNRDEWNGVFFDDGVFKVYLFLYGCGTEELYKTRVTIIVGGNKSNSGGKSTTMISENQLDRNQEITIFPNPTNAFIRIDGLNNVDYEFEIFNSLGQNMEGFYNIKENIIDIKHFSSGHYHIKIKSSNQIITKEFIVL